MTTWDERYRSGTFVPPDGPSPILAAKVDDLPTGRALDIATGTGRNARFLAGHGYAVDALDASSEALDRARRAAESDGVDVNWMLADIDSFDFPSGAYEVITMSFYRAFDRLADIEGALKPGGMLLHEHHLRTPEPVERGPPDDRYRLRSNDLLRAHLGLDVLFYEEAERRTGDGRAIVAGILTRKPGGESDPYPESLFG